MDEKALLDKLSVVPLFAALDKKSLEKLADLCVPRTFAAGETVLKEGDVGLGLYLVTSGKVSVSKKDGDEAVELGVVDPGSVVGEMALFDDQPRSASVVALEPTEALLISRETFSELARKDTEIAWSIVPALTRRIRELDLLRVEAGRPGADEAFANEAKREAEADAGKVAGTTAEATAAAAPEEEKKDDENDWSDSLSESTIDFLRLQYALGMGMIEGFTGMLRVSERFFSSLADGTELRESDRLGDVIEQLPDGLLDATKAAIRESEKVPERMADSFRSHLEKA